MTDFEEWANTPFVQGDPPRIIWSDVASAIAGFIGVSIFGGFAELIEAAFAVLIRPVDAVGNALSTAVGRLFIDIDTGGAVARISESGEAAVLLAVIVTLGGGYLVAVVISEVIDR